MTPEERKRDARRRTKEWRKNNPEKYKILHERFREYRKNWSKQHPLERAKSYNTYYKKKRLEILLLIGGAELKCKRCGFDDDRALQIDHINGNGYAEREIQRHLNKYIKHVEKNLMNYQILCANCNWIKVYENKENAKK